MITHLSVIRCDDDATINKVAGQITTCSYWRPGLKGGRERGYYNGVVHHMFRVNKADGTFVIIVALN
jgi:hypothetical protein